MAGHDQALLLELLGDVAGAGAGDLDPGLGEGGAGEEHVGNEEGGVDGVEEGVLEVEWWRPAYLSVSLLEWLGSGNE